MKNKKMPWNKNTIIILFILFADLVFIVPWIINALFTIPAPLTSLQGQWNAGDLLSFYGILLGAAIASAGVYASIQYSQKNYREDLRVRGIPFIVVIPYFRQHAVNPFSLLSGEICADTKKAGMGNALYNFFDLSEKYRELREYAFVFADDSFEVRTSLSQDQIRNVCVGFKVIQSDTESSLDATLGYAQFAVENAGFGSAVNIRVGLNRKGITPVFTVPTVLKSGDRLMVYIYSDGDGGQDLGEYLFCYHCEDIFGHKYVREYDLIIENTPKGKIISINLDGSMRRMN